MLEHLLQCRPAATALRSRATALGEVLDGPRPGRDLGLDLVIRQSGAVAHVHDNRLGLPNSQRQGAAVVVLDVEPSETVTPLMVIVLVGFSSEPPNELIFCATARPAESICPSAEYL